MVAEDTAAHRSSRQEGLQTKIPPRPAHGDTPPKSHTDNTRHDCSNLAMTAEEQEATIRAAFTNEETFPSETELKDAIGKCTSLVMPRHQALDHAAAPLIKSYATQGCPTDCGPDWSKDHIIAAIEKGPHASALKPDALKALHDETWDKVKNGYAKVVRFGDIMDNIPPKLKISPVAMIPHKSRAFRTILDLSFRLKHQGKLMESVNSATVQQAPAEAMIQLGHCMKRLVALLAENHDPHHPFKFAKLDIKDGFWRMAVNNHDAWNFCYVLPHINPSTKVEDALIVVPNCLQMGWCESPPFFCAASETARDVIEALLAETSLPPHAFEDTMMQGNTDDPSARLAGAIQYVNLVEVFVDDFIAATNEISEDHLRKFSRAMLLGVHSVFPPPAFTGHQGEDPISQKKLKQGEGTWATTKEILGWLVDGANFTITLLPEKCAKISKLIKKITKMKACPLQKFQELAGKLQHASFAIPGGRGLFSPIYRAMKNPAKFVKITPLLRQTLQDWRTLVQHLARHPTPVKLLVSDYPNFVLFTDACGLGAGGVVTPGLDPSKHWVWQLEWPEDIKRRLISLANPQGDITINDLELAGLVLGWLVLEHVCDHLTFKHVGMFCDNTSAVSWAFKGSTSTSIIAGRLLRFLALRQRTRQTSSLLPLHVAGEHNRLADVPSRAFQSGEYFVAHKNLTAYFNTHFPLSQGLSWHEYKLPTKLASRVISCLRGVPSQMESLHKLPRLAKNTGSTGATIAASAAQIPSYQTSSLANVQSSSLHLPQGYGQGLSVSEIRSKFRPSRTRSRPSPRPANWLENQVPSSKARENTFYPSSAL